MDGSPPGSSVHGILQARILDWVAISSFKGSSQHRDWTQVSHIAGGFFTIWATRKTPPGKPNLQYTEGLFSGSSQSIQKFPPHSLIWNCGFLWEMLLEVFMQATQAHAHTRTHTHTHTHTKTHTHVPPAQTYIEKRTKKAQELLSIWHFLLLKIRVIIFSKHCQHFRK